MTGSAPEHTEVPAIKVERRDDVVWVRLQRPERMNAYDLAMARDMIAGIEDADDAYAVVITGTGRAFCAGGALGQLEDPDPRQLRQLFTTSHKLVNAIRSCPRPVIAAVNGVAAGGGNELVVACDFAIAARSATFGQTGPKVGSAPVLGGTNFLGPVLGDKRGKEMAMMCRRYSAEQALEIGMVNEVVDDADLVAAVDRWVGEIKRLSPRYLEIAKASTNVWWNLAQDNMHQALATLIQAIGSDDMTEGAAAFLEKRRPEFTPPFTRPVSSERNES
ncbi:enoyl-CoA hydratase/isomerase family protein [Granulicoccus phenolivorans]|uniref:enoyl-CoA hydratase/isomerase family protein n=1 Tax=Granulicoccus phenolivorans TaxID=266854 RepID=UPI0003F5D4EB|nr:enoyl-CoA hydratase/isomerase family protein [Granulicoccus phenolivorans]